MSLSRVQLFATPWTAAYQAPLSMGFSRQEYWNGVPLPSPERKGIELQDRMQVYMMGPAILSSSFIKVKKIAFFLKKKCYSLNYLTRSYLSHVYKAVK